MPRPTPNWATKTPQEESMNGYQLVFWENHIATEDVWMLRQEYIELKAHLARMRGHLPPAPVAEREQPADWQYYTPAVQHPYTLTLWAEGVAEQEIELDREEFILLKRTLAIHRGIIPQPGPKP